jgi:IS1 transposase
VVAGAERGVPAVVVRKVLEVEVDEMGAFVGGQRHPRWLWGALDPQQGRILAYVFGRREDHLRIFLSRQGCFRRLHYEGVG